MRGSEQIYPLESFSGNKNSYVNNKGSVVFEVNKYQFLQKEIVELQGIYYQETEASLAESPYSTELEKSVLRAGFQILGKDEGERFFPLPDEGLYAVVRRQIEGNPEFKRIYIKSGDTLGEIGIWKESNGEYHADYNYKYKEAWNRVGGFNGETIEEVVRKVADKLRKEVDEINEAEEAERLGVIGEQIDSIDVEPDDELAEENLEQESLGGEVPEDDLEENM